MLKLIKSSWCGHVELGSPCPLPLSIVWKFHELLNWHLYFQDACLSLRPSHCSLRAPRRLSDPLPCTTGQAPWPEGQSSLSLGPAAWWQFPAQCGGQKGQPVSLPTADHLALCPQMLSCLEHMYHDLGLVRDFSINAITLRRWLVSAEPTLVLPLSSGHWRE